jgi:hypothetical protein
MTRFVSKQIGNPPVRHWYEIKADWLPGIPLCSGRPESLSERDGERICLHCELAMHAEER